MSDNLEFGVMLSTMGADRDPDGFRRIAETTETRGFDALWAGDHITIPETVTGRYPFSSSGESPFYISQDIYDVFEVLSYLAGITSEVNLGTNACIAPYRHPVVLAKNALTLEALSEGRFEFGVAPGWMKSEFEVLDVPFEDRGPLTDEFLELFDRTCMEPEFAFEGAYHEFQTTGFYPTPDRNRPPIWIGGRSEASFRRVAQFGDGWTINWARPPEIRECRSRITTLWDEYERDGEPEIAVFRPLHVGDGRDETRPLVGTPNSIIEDIQEYAAAGVTRIVLGFFTMDVDETIHQIELFEDGVMLSL